MEFKIEARDSFFIVTPNVVMLSAILADELIADIENHGQLGSSNLIIDLENTGGVEPVVIDRLVRWHEDWYANGRSLVFAQPGKEFLALARQTDKDLLLNIAPKMIEAIDIVSMEILERDLLGEE
jgi:hypothetical protein